MTQKIKVTSDEFKGLLNPYTGEPMTVMMIVGGPGPVKFYSTGTYSTTDRFPSAKAAYEAWSRVGGVSGVRTGGPVLCAYTGAPLSRMKDDAGYYLVGGFDPAVPRVREEFRRLVWMRDGKSPYEKAAGAAQRVDPAGGGKAAWAGRKEISATDETLGLAAGVMKTSGFTPPKKTVVNGTSLPKKPHAKGGGKAK